MLQMVKSFLENRFVTCLLCVCISVCVQVSVFVFQRVHQLLLCQAHQVLQDQLAPLDPLEFQVRKLLLCWFFFLFFFLQAPCIAVYPVFNLICNVCCLYHATLSGRARLFKQSRYTWSSPFPAEGPRSQAELGRRWPQGRNELQSQGSGTKGGLKDEEIGNPVVLSWSDEYHLERGQIQQLNSNFIASQENKLVFDFFPCIRIEVHMYFPVLLLISKKNQKSHWPLKCHIAFLCHSQLYSWS